MQNFEPLGVFLKALAGQVSDGRTSCRLERKEEMHQIAPQTFEVRYELLGAGLESRPLTFTLCGQDADKIVFRWKKHSFPREVVDHPSRNEPPTYRLDEMVSLMECVQDRMISHMSA
jgi:hypothetical protein